MAYLRMKIGNAWLPSRSQVLGLSEQSAVMHEEKHAEIDGKPRFSLICFHEFLKPLEDIPLHG